MDILIKKMFEYERWKELLEIASEKELDKDLIIKFMKPDERKKLAYIIASDSYTIAPPHIAFIPKDDGTMREVYVNEDLDRIVLTLINNVLCEIFKNKIHPKCVSYQKGLGTQMVVEQISREITQMGIDNPHIERCGYKSDFSKYFDNVSLKAIDRVFNECERGLGYEYNKHPVFNLLRRYYHQDLYFNKDGKLGNRYQGLKQGCAVASFLANVVLYELDEFMSNKYRIYYRYSDDLVAIDKNTDDVIDDINRVICKYGVTLNPKKVEPIYKDEWFKFLGFMIKGSQITLSKKRIKNFEKEIRKRSVDKRKCSESKARYLIMKYLYEGERAWAMSCLSCINVESDIAEMNKFIMDCIKACKTGKKRIGGLGVTYNLPDKTIIRGKGKHVTSNKINNGYIERYLSVQCLRKDLKYNRDLFDVVLKGL